MRATSRNSSRLGLLLAIVALVVQLAAGGVAAHGPDARALDGLVAASICHGGATPADPGPPPHHADCAVCPLCQIVAQIAVGPSGAVVPAPRPTNGVAYALPPPRAPPSRYAAAASARGPPVPDLS